MARVVAMTGAFMALCLMALGQGKAAVPAPEAGKDNVVKILRTSNKGQTSRFVCEAYEFKKINPFDVVNYFWAMTSREEGGIYSFANPDGKSGLITVICPEYQLESMRRLAKELDREDMNSSPGTAYTYYRMRYRNIADPNFMKVLGYYAGSSALLVNDVETNSIHFQDAPVGSESLAKTLKEELDQPLTQVEVAVKIYEVAVSSDGAMGLDFEAWKNGPGKVLYQLANKARHIAYTRSDGSISANTNAQGFYLDYPTAFFDFLTEKGKAKILSSVKVMAMNKAQAQVVAGDRILFYQETEINTLNPATGAVAADREVKGTLAAADTGVTLGVTPTVGEKTINLDLNLAITNVLGYDASGAPVLGRRNLTNSTAVASGDEIVFGGLARKRNLGMTRKIPVLGSLPVIGYLVGGEQAIMRDTLIITTVSPRLVEKSDNTGPDDKLIECKAKGEAVVVLP
ncbi:MAG: hypothetical protein NTX50_12735 [Candidatus Sumerlaeota bacterium]|nr:hypothetical protein [Candidatus Sumerlaeota bacterium]